LLDEPPDADPHVRWCERGRLAAASYSIISIKTSRLKINTSINTCSDDASPHRAVSFGQLNNERINARHMMIDKQTYDEKHNQPQRYEIRLKGHLDERWTEWFEGLTITLEENGDTLLTGVVIDQSALHGLLKKVRDLGMPLISVCTVKPRQDGIQEIKPSKLI
jgi:hypothetical protein